MLHTEFITMQRQSIANCFTDRQLSVISTYMCDEAQFVVDTLGYTKPDNKSYR